MIPKGAPDSITIGHSAKSHGRRQTQRTMNGCCYFIQDENQTKISYLIHAIESWPLYLIIVCVCAHMCAFS